MFNDAAVAAEALRSGDRLARAERIAIVDLDVHQGDGTASIFHGSAHVFTLSLHGARNYPFRRCASHIDIDLADGTGDDEYLAALDRALRQLRERFVADFLRSIPHDEQPHVDLYAKTPQDRVLLRCGPYTGVIMPLAAE